MKRATYFILLSGIFLLLVASCASMGTPSGGPRDEDPPRFVASNPLMGETEVTPNKVVLTFDELVNVKDAFTKVVVSPPMGQIPRVSSLGRRVTVEFRDTLLPNTTYTIDFGDAIVDNNEGNKLDNFMFTFSTGPELDSLMVSGMVLDALDLTPPSGMYVGLHTSMEDSAFMKKRFDRIAKTDENGKFVIGGLPVGQYRIYALEDKDGNMFWSSPEEALAFYDVILEPYSEQTTARDTIFNMLTGAVDSLVTRQRTRFLPNNILLRSYNTGYKQQYITKYERQDSSRINLIFNNAADSLPRLDIITTLGDIRPISEVAVVERSATNDTIALWMKEKTLIRQDTLRLAVEYLRADSAYNMVATNDTLRLLTPPPAKKPKAEKEKKSKSESSDSVAPPVPTLEWKVINAKPEVNQNIIFELPEPPLTMNPEMIHMEVMIDSVWQPAKDFDVGKVVADSLNPRRFRIDYPWEYATEYKLVIDSLAAQGIHGLFTDDLSHSFKTREESEYGSLRLNLSNYGDGNVNRIVQLLDASGNPKLTEPLKNGSVTFRFLMPGKYNVRVIEDYNGNGKWDPGIFERGVQPDVSYYYKETIELKANWDQEIDWNVFGVAVDKMKPESLQKKKSGGR